MTNGTAPTPTTASIPLSVSEAGRVLRTPDPHRAPKPTGAEVERAAFGLKVMYDGVDAEVEYVVSPLSSNLTMASKIYGRSII